MTRKSPSPIRAILAKLLLIAGLVLGQVPRVAALVGLFQQPVIARVLLTRRRRLAYSEFFTLHDHDGRRAAPLARVAAKHAHHDATPAYHSTAERFIPVQTA